MELLLIILGGALSAAIIFTMIERLRGPGFDEDDEGFDNVSFDDRAMTPELRAYLKRIKSKR
ncbi:hypothetical protein [Yoonia sp. SS1-5]|uniref:Uncharacterized protein n=1 Tax=Yoonia rhodophyticola TaxID=3137370 RepID=A0AAN0M7C4_9RHOB